MYLSINAHHMHQTHLSFVIQGLQGPAGRRSSWVLVHKRPLARHSDFVLNILRRKGSVRMNPLERNLEDKTPESFPQNQDQAWHRWWSWMEHRWPCCLATEIMQSSSSIWKNWKHCHMVHCIFCTFYIFNINNQHVAPWYLFLNAL